MTSRGQEYMDQAEKRLKKWSLFGGGSKYEEAADLFEKAANQFKISKEWKSAGTASMRCSDCYHHAKEPYNCAIKLAEAARCFHKVEGDQCAADTVKCLEHAIEVHQDDGKFLNAAKLLKELGGIHSDHDNGADAAKAYQKAADFYSGEGQSTHANEVLRELARVYCDSCMYTEGVETLEKVAKSYAAHGQMKYQIKEVLLRAMMCRFAQIKPDSKEVSAEQCQEALGRYLDLDPTLQGSRDHELMEGVTTAIEQDDPEAVSKAAAIYDDAKKLSDWQVKVLSHVKEVLKDDSHDLC